MLWRNSKNAFSAGSNIGREQERKERLEKYSGTLNFREASTLINFINENVEILKTEKVRGIWDSGHPEWSANTLGRPSFCTDHAVFVEFDQFLLKIDYLFDSDLRMRVFPKENFPEGEEFYDVQDKSPAIRNDRLVLAENSVKEVIVQLFSHEFETEASGGSIRPEGGDYFSAIIMMFGETGLWIKPEAAEMDGYLDYELIDGAELETMVGNTQYTYKRIFVETEEEAVNNPRREFEELVAERGCEFENRINFNYYEWARKNSVAGSEIPMRLYNMNLKGRKISDIRFTSRVYNFSAECLEETISNLIRFYPEDIVKDLDFKRLPDEFPIPMVFKMDEPVLIKFEDGDVLEIFNPWEGKFIVSMNEIPWEAKGRINKENVNGSKICEFCKGATITEVRVAPGKDALGEDGILVVRLEWENEGGWKYAFLFQSRDFDYMELAATDRFGNVLKYPYAKVIESMYKFPEH